MLRCFSWASAAWQAANRELKLSLGRLLTAEFPPLVRKLSLFQAACICLQAGKSQAGRSTSGAHFLLAPWLCLPGCLHQCRPVARADACSPAAQLEPRPHMQPSPVALDTIHFLGLRWGTRHQEAPGQHRQGPEGGTTPL